MFICDLNYRGVDLWRLNKISFATGDARSTGQSVPNFYSSNSNESTPRTRVAGEMTKLVIIEEKVMGETLSLQCTYGDSYI